MSNAWVRQSSFPTSKTYISGKRGGIWHDVSVKRDSNVQVTDRQASKGNLSDCRGNLIPRKSSSPRRKFMVAKIFVERLIDELPLSQRMEITPRQKWDMVERLAAA